MSQEGQLPTIRTTLRWWILANVSLGIFMSTLDGSITNVALPSISGTLDVPLHIVQWVVTAYLLAIASLLPIIGKLSDLFGRGNLYNLGFLIFLIGSALCGLSKSIWMLIGMRVLQAAGAALLMANSQAIIAATFPKEERGRALGITGMVVSLGSLSGPAIGGILVDSFGWESIFWINVPIGLIGFIAALRIMPKQHQKRVGEPFDYLGSIMYMTSMITFLYTISNAEEHGWTTGITLGGLLFSFIIFVLFYRRETRISHPMLDFSLFKIRTFRSGSFATLLSFLSLFCITILMPFYMQLVLEYPPNIVGYVMMANAVMMAIVAPFSGWLSDKIGCYYLTISGLVINAISFVLLTKLTTNEPAWLVATHMGIFGIGTGLFLSPNNASILGSVPPTLLGAAGGLNALVRNIGMVLGTTFAISLFSFQLNRLTEDQSGFSSTDILNVEAYMTALHTVFWVAAVICLFAAVLSSMRDKPQRQKRKVA
ncbi:MFS transporter [Brevibacillus laterosporus]|uniref:Drug resistance transporter, EmrB/QacA subfamily n=1 Tax=Brevibacillus laterosporus LMG 15441 TaxID=1042163 RepID=A0A075R2W5_BRELA|nr:MFS transporter [Brevibacillus laterosporus]AIG26882.1 drug resistance transporter, EmrB/QacA subfamily [Brevibacillus laterosporus LMG 15441]RJL14563.1 MFS transporter [Brevibacillus laterosporus]